MIEIIPAIDIIEGKCVRLSQGDYQQKKVYNEHPLEVAKEFADTGIRRLHVVDLDGAKAQHIVNHKVLESIATHTDLVIDFGGGLKSDDDLRIAFECGAAMITGGSIAVKQPELFAHWIERYGSERIILGADVHGEKIAVGGWLETTDNDLIPFIERDIWQRWKSNPSFALYGIDRDEPLDVVKGFIQSMKITYPLALDPGAAHFQLYADKEAGVTRNVIINKKGEIVFLTRLYNESEFKAMVTKIEELLK